jgi:UDP-N-acetylglucosamine 2-epimerase
MHSPGVAGHLSVLTVLGTRPEAVKLAPVIHSLESEARITSRVCVTGQHRELLEPFLSLFQIDSSIHLRLMEVNQSLPGFFSKALTSIGDVLDAEKPGVVLVHGDTTTALAACLAAYYRQIPIGHVEAGLRTGDKYSPFPEEMNRRWIDAVSDWLFAPTEHARRCLLAEAIPEDKVFVTGNTVIDALQWMVGKQSAPGRDQYLTEQMAETHGLVLDERRLILVTGHRRESFGKPFEQVCLALRQIAEQNPDVLLVYPVHLNPNVRRPVMDILNGIPNVHLIEPLGYEEFVYLMRRAAFILTDSGGIQEEAPSLSKPVLVMREKTERPEAIEAGVARLVGTDVQTIACAAQLLLDDSLAYDAMSTGGSPFGDGHAAERIVRILLEGDG